MTFTLPGPTPDTYYECHHVFVGNCTPLEVRLVSGVVTISKGKVVKARRRPIRMKADKATFNLSK